MIGIFDSGFGGLTVMKEFLKRFPDFDYLYLGDQANVPYGSRSPERVNELLAKNVSWMISRGCRLIVVACNTASAEALRHVQQIYKGDPVILGVLVPATEEALLKTRRGAIGVIGTRGTIASGAYEREIQKRAAALCRDAKSCVSTNGVRVYPKACPLLVPLIEEGWAHKPETTMILKKYLRSLKDAHADTLILGCTHYPILAKAIQRVMGKNVRLIDSGAAAAEAMKRYFEKHPDLLPKLSRNSEQKFYTTDNPQRFSELGGKFLGKRIKAERVAIE